MKLKSGGYFGFDLRKELEVAGDSMSVVLRQPLEDEEHAANVWRCDSSKRFTPKFIWEVTYLNTEQTVVRGMMYLLDNPGGERWFNLYVDNPATLVPSNGVRVLKQTFVREVIRRNSWSVEDIKGI